MKKKTTTSAVTDSVPGLTFLTKLANDPPRTPRRRKSLRKIRSYRPDSRIFKWTIKGRFKPSPGRILNRSSKSAKSNPLPKPNIPSKPENVKSKPLPKTRKWLQHFLLKCGGGNRQKVKDRKSHEVKSSLMRKLLISENRCERKGSPQKSIPRSQSRSVPSNLSKQHQAYSQNR